MAPHPSPSISLRPRQPPERERETEEAFERDPTKKSNYEGPGCHTREPPRISPRYTSSPRSPRKQWEKPRRAPREHCRALRESLTEPRRRAQASPIKSKSDPRGSPSTPSSHSFQTTSVVASQQQQPQCPQQPPERSLGSRDSSRDSHRGSCF